MSGEIKASHILVDTEAEAIALKEEILAGKPFEEAAKEYSSCPSGKKGGDLGLTFFYGFLNPNEWCKPTDSPWDWAGSPFQTVSNLIQGHVYKLCDPNFAAKEKPKTRPRRDRRWSSPWAGRPSRRRFKCNLRQPPPPINPRRLRLWFRDAKRPNPPPPRRPRPWRMRPTATPRI